MSGTDIAADLDVVEYSNPRTKPYVCACGSWVTSVPSSYSPNNPHTVGCRECGRERQVFGRLVDTRIIKHQPT